MRLEGEPRERLTTASSILVGALLAWTGQVMSHSVSVYCELFKGLGMDVPVTTQAFLAVPAPGYLIAGLAGSVLVVAKDWIVKRDRTRLQINVLVTVATFAAFQAFFYEMSRPMMEFMERI